MDKMIKRLEELSFLQAVLLAVLIAGIYYFTSFDDGAGLAKEAETWQKRAIEARGLLSETSQKLKQGQKFEREVKKLRETYSQLLTYLPVELDTRRIRESIVQQTGLSGAKVVKVNLEEFRNKTAEFEEVFFDVEVEGSYVSLADFLARVTQIDKLLVFKKIEITRKSETEKDSPLVLKGRVATYRYIEES